MNPFNTMQSSCTGKQGITSRTLAQEISQRSRRSKEGFVSEYKCTYCGLWHVGNGAKRQHQIKENRSHA